MAARRVNATRIIVLIEDPAQGRIAAEVLGSARWSSEWPMEGGPGVHTVSLQGEVISRIAWDGSSPMRPRAELEPGRSELEP